MVPLPASVDVPRPTRTAPSECAPPPPPAVAPADSARGADGQGDPAWLSDTVAFGTVALADGTPAAGADGTFWTGFSPDGRRLGYLARGRIYVQDLW